MAVTPNIRFSNSNSLRFIRLEDYDFLESDTTRLYYDFNYTAISNDCYFQKLSQSLGVWVQYRTNYDNVNVFLIAEDETETDVASYITSGIELTGERVQYQLTLDLSSYTGYYCLRFDFQDYDKPLATFQSEWFEVAASYDNCHLFEWKNASFNPYDDGIIWASTTQYMYIESHLVDNIPGVSKTVFTTENGKQITTQARPTKSKNLLTELIPDYICDLLNLAMAHDYFYINQVRYNSEETIEVERQGLTRLYPASVTLMVVEDAQGNAYEDYTQDQAITGDLPVIESGFVLINSTDYILINATDKLLKS